jgi:Arc/MetJ-type ribon-helix-helix transcriptional regulator
MTEPIVSPVAFAAHIKLSTPKGLARVRKVIELYTECMVSFLHMSITLTPEQQRWLEGEVAAGHFPSVEDAVRMAVADFKDINIDDLSWAKPYVHQARGSLARGEVISGDEFLKSLDVRLAVLRSS